MIAIDTTGIIDLFKGEKAIKKVLEKIKEPVCCTQLNYLEIQFGINPDNPKHELEFEYYEEFFDEVKPLTLDKEGMKKSSELFWKLKKQGKQIGKFDCIIAGTLISHNVNKIITRNVKHFKKVPNLKVISY